MLHFEEYIQIKQNEQKTRLYIEINIIIPNLLQSFFKNIGNLCVPDMCNYLFT